MTARLSWWAQCALFLTFTGTAFAGRGPRVTELVLSNKNVSPDGFTRAASLINGKSPGPLLTVNKGDGINVNVVNKLSDSNQLLGATVHWHGILQKTTNFMDGVEGVTQCPIAPGDSFQYSFNTDVAGTFWYHSHYGVQYCDGVRGVLVVYDPDDPLKSFYDVDNEDTIITLSEWYHVLATTIHTHPTADSTLINGKGRYPGGPNVDLAVVNVHKGKRYRLRVVSISCDPGFQFSIDNHDLTVIEVESTAVKPYTVNTIEMLAGQRYSVVLNANQPPDNYWIRALQSTGNRGLNSTFANGVNSAILRYNGATKREPKSTQQITQNKLVETELHPMVDPMAPGLATPDGADYVFNLNLTFNPETFIFSVDGRSFIPPTVPVLLQIMSGARSAHDLLPDGSIFTVERNKTVQINIPGGLEGGPHPFHLHGHDFSVIKSANSGHFNFLDPIRRDVVSSSTDVGDYVSIRFRTDNPGPWIIHCHIDFHLAWGLAFVFAEAPDDTMTWNGNPPDEWSNLCPTWDALPDNVRQVQTHITPSAGT